VKLILCLECQDVVKIGTRGERRYCLCRKSWGLYKNDGKHAVIGGKAVPFGLDNITLARGVRNRPKDGVGPGVTAWVFPEKAARIEMDEKPMSEKVKRVVLRLPPDLVEWVDSQIPKLGTTRNAAITALFRQVKAEMEMEARVTALEKRLATLEAG